MISIIVPLLNEISALGTFLSHLDVMEGEFELLFVDGGSADGSAGRVRAYCDARPARRRFLQSPPGRARQMNLGAGEATGDILLFLHVDTLLPARALAAISDSLADGKALGGRFKLRMSGSGWQYRLVEAGINWRDRASGGFTGDQAIFVLRHAFESLGGFPEIPVCEDVEFVRRLRREGSLVPLPDRVITSSRRYERWGPFRTAVRMWWIKGLYLAGYPAERLSTFFPDVR